MRQIDGNCNYTEDIAGYTFHTRCPSCKTTKDVSVQSEDLFKYRQGAHVQDAFPYLSSVEREALLTGFCDPCWNKVMSY
jgi:hypothetical protein